MEGRFELLGRIDARIVGTVLNRAPDSASYGYGYAYYGSSEPIITNGTAGNGKLSTHVNGATPAHAPYKGAQLPFPNLESSDIPDPA